MYIIYDNLVNVFFYFLILLFSNNKLVYYFVHVVWDVKYVNNVSTALSERDGKKYTGDFFSLSIIYPSLYIITNSKYSTKKTISYYVLYSRARKL